MTNGEQYAEVAPAHLALAATVLLVRQQDGAVAMDRLTRLLPAGEAKADVSLERMREMGL